jgi:hypothetical protein
MKSLSCPQGQFKAILIACLQSTIYRGFSVSGKPGRFTGFFQAVLKKWGLIEPGFGVGR